MRSVLLICSAIIMLCFPLVIYFGLQHVSIATLAPALIAVLMVRLFFSRHLRHTMPWVIPGAVAGVGCLLLAMLSNRPDISLLYPVLMSLVMVVTFAWSLKTQYSVIESFARVQLKLKLTQPTPATVKAYTRTVTKVWCGFFLVNAAIATYTVYFTELKIWTLFNGLISYCLMGLLMLVEWCVRPKSPAAVEQSAQMDK